MLWLKKGFGFAGDWTVNDHNDLLEHLFGPQKSTNHEKAAAHAIVSTCWIVCDRPRSSESSIQL